MSKRYDDCMAFLDAALPLPDGIDDKDVSTNWSEVRELYHSHGLRCGFAGCETCGDSPQTFR